MKKIILIAAMLLSLTGMKAQQVSEIYEELPNPVTTDVSKWARVTKPIISWEAPMYATTRSCRRR